MMTTKKKVDWKIVCTALICITLLEVYALSVGIDGLILSIVIALIAGAAGIVIPSPIQTK